MNKTPYEIRLELLKMANEILITPVHGNRDARMQEYHSKMTEFNRETLPFPTLPDFPTSSDIIMKAEELKRFIDQA